MRKFIVLTLIFNWSLNLFAVSGNLLVTNSSKYSVAVSIITKNDNCSVSASAMLQTGDSKNFSSEKQGAGGWFNTAANVDCSVQYEANLSILAQDGSTLGDIVFDQSDGLGDSTKMEIKDDAKNEDLIAVCIHCKKPNEVLKIFNVKTKTVSQKML